MTLKEKLEQRGELELRDLSIIDEFQECVYGAEVRDLECLMAFQQGCLAFAQRVFAEKVQNCVRAVPSTSFAVQDRMEEIAHCPPFTTTRMIPDSVRPRAVLTA